MISPEFVEFRVVDIDNSDGWLLVVRVDDIVSVRYPPDTYDAPIDCCEVALRTGVIHTVHGTVREVVREMSGSGRCKVTNNPSPYSKTTADKAACGVG